MVAREKAVIWHNAKKAERLALASYEANLTLKKLEGEKREIVELALAFLYLGEGSKKAIGTSMGNSDPTILRFFINALRFIYEIPTTDFKCELHLRADQNPILMKKYWSKELGLPLSNFGAVMLDIRTAGKPTYVHYKGVCVVRCSRVAIQRKLMYIARGFCDKIKITN